jgi:hypothetical protein
LKGKIHLSALAFIILSSVGCNLFQSNEKLPKTFLIHSTYEGTLRIVFEEACGIKPPVENGGQIFEFQKNGILIISTHLVNGPNDDYYLVDSHGNKEKVKQITNLKERVDKMPVVIVGGIGVTSSFVNYVNDVITQKTGGAAYQDYNLYNTNTTEIRKSVESPYLDSLTNAVVMACRRH